MNAVLRKTDLSEQDLIDIWIYIAQDNPDAADRVLDEIVAKCHLLAEYPRLGPARPDIWADLRYFPVGSYLILYREIEGGVEIVAWRPVPATCPNCSILNRAK